MRFSLFAHLERLDDAQSHEQLYGQFMALCETADAAGFHAIWTGEHHAMNFTIAPNPFINIADLARRTKNVRLGTGTLIAPFWHPIKLAGEAAMTDIICNGRLEIGIARGAYQFEYDRLSPGLDAWTAGRKMRELIPAVIKLWRGDYAHDGEFWTFPPSTAAPKPLQQPHPPLWIAARDPNSHQFAIENGCNVQCTPLWQSDDEVESLMKTFNDACATVKKPRPKIMLLRHTFVADDEEEIAAAAAEMSRYYCHFSAWFKNAHAAKQGTLTLDEKETAAMTMFSPATMRANNVIGTAAQTIERLRRYEQLGFDEYALWLDNGMSFARKQKCLRLFADKVMPAFASTK